jgi:hypothetical protein
MLEQSYLRRAREFQSSATEDEGQICPARPPSDEDNSAFLAAFRCETSERSERSTLEPKDAKSVVSEIWTDPQPDVCQTCGGAAIGYSEAAWKACAEHLGAGCRW